MIKLTQKLDNPSDANNITAHAYLPIETRIKSRARITLNTGEEAGWVLPRGELIRGGDVLVGECGTQVEIRAADQRVSTATFTTGLMQAQAAYHLGNRHVPIQITKDTLCYQHDHVLDDMLKGLGLDVTVHDAPFEPEAGAYQQMGAHSHHGHSHD